MKRFFHGSALTLATVAYVAAVAPHATPSLASSTLRLALGPWVGADLPTGIPGARRWRLAANGRPGTTVLFATSGLPKHWVASFCTDKVCSPNRYDAVLDRSGTTAVEFQIIPDPEVKQSHVTVRIAASDGNARASARAVFR